MSAAWIIMLNTSVLSYMIGNTVKNCFIFKIMNNDINQFNRFLSEYFIYMHTNVYKNHPNKWLKVLERCKKKSFLRVMSCMQLTSKYAQQSLVSKIQSQYY